MALVVHFFGLDGAKLRHPNLVVRENFKQKHFKCFISVVELIDQEHSFRARLAGQRIEHGAMDQVFFRKDVFSMSER